MTQRDALNLLKTGKNIFITGPAGSGKTFVVNEYIKYLKDHDVPVGITASTGIAATHMGGVTIHSWSGMGVASYLNEGDLQKLSEKARTADRIKEAKVLIIDEVSMLHHFRLDILNDITKHVRKSNEPFGGLQVVLCGDFFQLPPVSKYGDQDAHFIYRSEAWKEGKFTVCYLHENYRQRDDGLLSILNEIRSGEVSDGARDQLNMHYRSSKGLAKPSAVSAGGNGLATRYSDEARPLSPRGNDGIEMVEPTRLFTHNVNVDVVNDAELAKVQETEFKYEMTSRGRKALVEGLKRSCLAPEVLRLRKGARVMCVKNNFEKGYVNGTLGVVISCGPDMDPIIHTAPTPEFPNGQKVTIELATWSIEDDGRVLAEITQYPLRLAWAITVHKSQGMSLDAIEVDLSRSFEPGMGYVALSRVRTLNGLTILGMNENALQVHPDVLQYDRHLRELSNKAEAILSTISEKEMSGAQEEFLAKVAPLHSLGKKGRKGKKVKEPKISTFEKTALLVKKGKSLSEIARERDMNSETIVAHLEKLIELGPNNGGLELKDIIHFKYDISPQHLAKIGKALEEVSLAQNDGKPPFLSPVKNKTGAYISFKEIRLARVLLGYFGRK